MTAVDKKMAGDMNDYVKQCQQALHPETKAGVAGGKASGVSRGTTAESATVHKPESFVVDTAAKTGKAERKTIYEALHPETKHGAKGGPGNCKAPQNETADSATSFVTDTASRWICTHGRRWRRMRLLSVRTREP